MFVKNRADHVPPYIDEAHWLASMVNIGLGNGAALDIFNDNIIDSAVVP
jgi:hypothetical protein